MQEMKIGDIDLAEFGARLLSFSVGGTDLTRTTGNSFNANFPKVFHTDFGQRKITVTVVFKPDPKIKGIISKLHHLAMNKSAFDALMFSGTVDLWLPDGFYYHCSTMSVEDENSDGESLEVTYTLNGIRHGSLSTQKGMTVYCNSTVKKTDCKITLTIADTLPADTTLRILVNRDTSEYNSIKISHVQPGDEIVIDSINTSVTKNGVNIFGDTNIIEFPTLIPGENTYTLVNQADITFTTEFYPIFV